MLFLAALVALGGVTSLGIIVAAGQRQRQIKARNRPAALQRELDELGQYIRDISQATSDDDINRLEQRREQGKQ